MGMLLCRYSPHGRWAVEENIAWGRLRIPPLDISPHALYTSDCLADLRPGDHVEIQWRRNREFPYGNISIELVKKCISVPLYASDMYFCKIKIK